MCVHVRTCARACVISEISTLFRVYAISLSTHTLYTCRIALIFSMWDYFDIFIFAGDVPSCGASDRVTDNMQKRARKHAHLCDNIV